MCGRIQYIQYDYATSINEHLPIWEGTYLFKEMNGLPRTGKHWSKLVPIHTHSLRSPPVGVQFGMPISTPTTFGRSEGRLLIQIGEPGGDDGFFIYSAAGMRCFEKSIIPDGFLNTGSGRRPDPIASAKTARLAVSSWKRLYKHVFRLIGQPGCRGRRAAAGSSQATVPVCG